MESCQGVEERLTLTAVGDEGFKGVTIKARRPSKKLYEDQSKDENGLIILINLLIGNMTLARIKKEVICEYGWTWWCRIIETCPQSQCWNLESENSPSILKFHDFHGQGIKFH